MSMRKTLDWGIPFVLAATLAACGGGPPDIEAPAPSPTSSPVPEPDEADGQATAEVDEEDGDEESSASPSAADKETELEELARYLIKRPGRRVAYSAEKRRFVFTRERAADGGGFTLDVIFADDSGHEVEAMRICTPATCDESLNDIAKKKIPELAQRFEREGYVSISAKGWPSTNELSTSKLDVELTLKDRRMTGKTKDGKKKALGTIDAKTPHLLSLFIVPEGDLIGYYAAPDPGGRNMDFGVFKVK